MRALAYHGRRDVRVDTVPDPRIDSATDAIIKVTSTAICGSDLHLYEVLGGYLDEGDVLGHEAMGIVEEVGSDVGRLSVGDRVVVPFNISCGSCFFCGRGLHSQCEKTHALSANSPFNEGVDTRYDSWRYILWSRWPTSGPPPLFVSLDHYESSLAAMLKVGAIVDKRNVYWDIRLSERQPTLEFRVCDVTQTPAEAALLAALIRAAAATALDDVDSISPHVLPLPQEVLRANLWRAAREGLRGRCLHPVSGELVDLPGLVDGLVDWVRPALRANGDADFVERELLRLREHGGGAARQRTVHDEHGSFEAVVDALAEPPL